MQRYRPDNRRVLMHFGFKLRSDGRFYERESPTADFCMVARWGDSVGYDEVKEAVREHLAPADPSHGRES